ncbi:MAG: MFS transporter [Defluviimonas sp.]|uniref:MFS transporter n=1 Tax=Albidovulum sp. TaxID=1872424 RepID=UPI001D77A8C6|nr:MFS transporter [Paracoccaceae bacterium]MCC0064535.1 MFS transporter [Defluviimonas sp.]
MTPQPTLAPFSNRAFRELWVASQISNLGGLIQMVGAAWLMAGLTNSHGMVALVQSSNTLPIMAFSLLSGALADSYDRRRIMLVAQGFMFTVSCLLAAVAWTGVLTPWLLLSFTFLIGCGMALYNPSWQASVGDIVPREQVSGAVGLNSMGFNLMRSVGPAIGGAIVAVAGAAAAFLANAASYVFLLVALFRWSGAPARPALPREDLGRALGAGLRYMAMSPSILKVMGRSALFGFAASALMALLPLYAKDTLSGSALLYGLLLGCFGLGAIGGVLVNARLRVLLGNENVTRAAFAGFALAVEVLAFLPHLAAVVPALLLAGSCWVLALSLFNTAVQLSTPRWVVGRAMSIYQTATFGGMSLGAWVWGHLSDTHGIGFALALAGLVLAIGALAGRLLRLSEFEDLDLTPLGLLTAAEPRLDLRARSGPVFIMVDYAIAQDDTDAFLALMRERRRIRLRDGAQRWALLRDLERPEIWSEKYYVPTWVDYTRHLSRRTKADVALQEAIRALHRGAEPPRVTRKIERQTVPEHDDAPPLPPADLA